jgi:hypothetical protein
MPVLLYLNLSGYIVQKTDATGKRRTPHCVEEIRGLDRSYAVAVRPDK